jgi:hypothetical protein
MMFNFLSSIRIHTITTHTASDSAPDLDDDHDDDDVFHSLSLNKCFPYYHKRDEQENILTIYEIILAISVTGNDDFLRTFEKMLRNYNVSV